MNICVVASCVSISVSSIFKRVRIRIEQHRVANKKETLQIRGRNVERSVEGKEMKNNKNYIHRKSKINSIKITNVYIHGKN